MFEIEDTPLGETRGRPKKHDLDAFINTLRKLDINQSFVVPNYPSHYRVASRVVSLLLDRQFSSRKTDGGVRIGRKS